MPPGPLPPRKRRRWPWVVLAALVLCVAVPVGAVVVWVVRVTVEASSGEGSPDAAVTVYLLALSGGDDSGVRRVLAEDRRDELAEQWRAMRRDMTRTDQPVSKLEFGSLGVEGQGDDAARVTAGVRGIWWGVDGSGVSIQGMEHPWGFDTRRDSGGWRVLRVDAHPWCGGHVRVDACR